MKYLGYIQFIVLVLFIWLGWQIIDRITFREEMITPLGAALQSAKNNRKELERVEDRQRNRLRIQSRKYMVR